jgi:outer membrane protein OmpA-like peptidoglycan-associated protein
VNTIPPDAELNELFSFHDDPDFLVGSAQGRAELRQLVLSPRMLKGGGPASGSGTASAVETSGVETSAPAVPPPHPRRLTLPQPWARRILAGAAAALAAIICAIGISFSNAPLSAEQTKPPTGVLLAESKKLKELASDAVPPRSAVSHASPAPAVVPSEVQVLTPFSIRFAANSTTLTPDEEAHIRDLAKIYNSFLIFHPNGRVTITGYTANTLDSALVEQQAMALTRARTVASLLVTTGIPAERMIVATGITDSSAIQNVALNADLAAQMQRVDITLQP